MLRPTIIFVIITSTIGGLQIFDEPRMFDKLGPGRRRPAVDDDHAVPLRARLGRQRNFGRAAAVAWMLFLIIIALRPHQLRDHPRIVHARDRGGSERAAEVSSHAAPSHPALAQSSRQSAPRAPRVAAASRITAASRARRAGSPTRPRRRRAGLGVFPLYWSFLIGSGDRGRRSRAPDPVAGCPGGNFVDERRPRSSTPASTSGRRCGNSIIVST